MKPEDTIEHILSKRPEISKQQLLDRLAVARDMTGGLIAEVSLWRMIAAELGVEIPSEEDTFKPKLSLGHIVAGLNNATVTGRVVAIYPAKTFEGTRSGKLASLIIVDNEGSIRVILWNDKASLVEADEVKVGQIIKFMHGYTKADRFGTAELHIGEKSQIELNPENVSEEEYPSIAKFQTKIKQISLEQKTLNLEGRIKDVLGSSTFTRNDQTPGMVLRLRLTDETGEVVAVFWNEKAQETEPKAKRGTRIEIVNARPKSNQNGEIEIHIDSSTYVNVSTPERCQIKIANITEALGDVCVEGEVATSPVNREVTTSKGEKIKVTTFDLKDETGIVRVNAWRDHAESTAKLLMGEKIMIENAYAKRGYNTKVELSTRTTTTINQTLK
jgi:replication factor A1